MIGDTTPPPRCRRPYTEAKASWNARPTPPPLGRTQRRSPLLLPGIVATYSGLNGPIWIPALPPPRAWVLRRPPPPPWGRRSLFGPDGPPRILGPSSSLGLDKCGVSLLLPGGAATETLPLLLPGQPISERRRPSSSLGVAVSLPPPFAAACIPTASRQWSGPQIGAFGCVLP